MQDSKLVFLGDSLTMRHNWSNFGAANMGIDGDTTTGVLSRMHLASKAKTIVLMIGANDILNRLMLPKIKNNYIKILKNFSQGQEIYILSILPVIDAKQTQGINHDIKEMNAWLKGQSKEYKFTYINLYPSFLDRHKKGLDNSLTTDGIHLTSKGYKLWESILKKSVHTPSH